MKGGPYCLLPRIRTLYLLLEVLYRLEGYYLVAISRGLMIVLVYKGLEASTGLEAIAY